MPSPSSLPANVTEVLERTLEEFREADKKGRKVIIKTLAKDTLPGGGDLQKHKKVSTFYIYFIVYSIGDNIVDGERMVLQPWKKTKSQGQSHLCEEVELEPGCRVHEKGGDSRYLSDGDRFYPGKTVVHCGLPEGIGNRGRKA